jgi:3-isopropylmalate/(R)-2-methylmalate dehydratase small subunit
VNEEGRAWKFGDGISTDHITPGRFYHLRSKPDELAKHVLVDAREEFASEVQPGDFVAAGNNFGLGSSREHAAVVIKLAGVRAVLAKSFARIFYRNAINVGLPVLVCNTDDIDEGDMLVLDIESSVVLDKTNGKRIPCEPIPPFMRQILDSGGLVNYVKEHGGFPG